MKTKNIYKSAGLIILMFMFSVISSCTKNSDNVQTKEEQGAETALIDEKDYSESNEDLTTVDYREFYDLLSSHGEWIEVSAEEIGMKASTSSSDGQNNKSFSASDLLGIKYANASSTASAGMVFVWKPLVDLAVTVPEVSVPVYVPYTNGQWVNSDAGWYFKARTPVEETVSHYGRWVNTPAAGWLWVPGRVWAPAWVDWKQNDTYVSWAPLPPSVYIENGVMSVPQIDDSRYVIVERKYFLEPDVYKYNTIYFNKEVVVPLNQLQRTDGIVVVNNTIINKGPDVNVFQNIYGKNIEKIKIKHAGNFREIKYADNEYTVYTPVFKRFKSKGNSKITVIGPKSFKKYDDWKVRKSDDQNSDNDQTNIRKENKGNDNGNVNKGNDKGKKNDDNDQGNKNKGNDSGNEKGNKNKGNDSGNEKGNKNKGNDNGKGNK
ncbi:MAG: hypothetical protein JST15_06185 [Bacteroidetes bacterium]|nr:hypothetical protein [Bacteroidota bacterium]